ncbi:MAG: hypothetical protein JXA71_00195, partial [Chitinispirillaceae bacterium]|nr:hypothetical protein [Chitinispirillaceae bacterium]
WDRRVGDYKIYLTFRIFTDAVSAFILKKHPPDLVTFIRKYELTEPQARGLVNWLIQANFLHSTSSRSREGYVPTRDFSKQPVGELLSEITSQDLKITATPDDYTREFVASLLRNSQGDSGAMAGKMTFEELVSALEEGEKRFSTTARTENKERHAVSS